MNELFHIKLNKYYIKILPAFTIITLSLLWNIYNEITLPKENR